MYETLREVVDDVQRQDQRLVITTRAVVLVAEREAKASASCRSSLARVEGEAMRRPDGVDRRRQSACQVDRV